MRQSGRIFRAALLASFVVAVLDVTKMSFGPFAGSWAELLTLAALWILFFGCCVGFFAQQWAYGIRSASKPFDDWRRDFFFALPLILFSWWVPFSWMSEHSRVLGVSGWALVVVYAFATLALWVGFCRAMHRFSMRSTPLPGAIVLPYLCWGAAFLGYWLDARLLVGLYEDFHVGLFVGSTFLCALGFWFLLPTLPRWLREPGRFDFFVFVGVATGFAASFLLIPWKSAPPSSLAFAKLSKIRSAFVADPLELEPSVAKSSQARTTYKVPPCEKCNVLLLTVDALRADHVGAYGYSRETTPELDKLAKKSLLFKNAFTQATKTFDSLPSIYSGVYPSHLDRNYKHPKLKKAKSYLFYVDEGTTFLSHRFKKINYQTATFYGFHFGDFGYHRGYDRVVEDRKDITPHLLKYIKTSEEPFFLSAHFHFPHEPYEKHAKFDFGDEPIDRYDSEVAFADQQIGKILRLLEQRQLLEKTIVIVSADHGEEFGEHGGKFHSRNLHQELLHVPLLVWHPHLPPQTVTDFVELVDVAPFLNDALALGAAPEEFDGQSLLAAARGQRDPVLRGAYSQNYVRKGLRAASLVTPEWRAIAGPDVGGFRLFDKVKDPAEQLDVSSQNPELEHTFIKLIQARSR